MKLPGAVGTETPNRPPEPDQPQLPLQHLVPAGTRHCPSGRLSSQETARWVSKAKPEWSPARDSGAHGVYLKEQSEAVTVYQVMPGWLSTLGPVGRLGQLRRQAENSSAASHWRLFWPEDIASKAWEMGDEAQSWEVCALSRFRPGMRRGRVGRGGWSQGSILGISHSCQTVKLMINEEVGDTAEGVWVRGYPRVP